MGNYFLTTRTTHAGIHFIYQRFAVLENGQVVLPEAPGDDFWEEVEVGFADDFLSPRQIDGFPQCATHVDLAGVGVFDHEERSGQVPGRLEKLRDAGHFLEKFCLEMRCGHKRILPFFGDLTIAFHAALE